MWRAVLGAAFLWGFAVPFSFAAVDIKITLCPGYTVVKRTYPPSTTPTGMAIKCPVPGKPGQWTDMIELRGSSLTYDKATETITVNK